MIVAAVDNPGTWRKAKAMVALYHLPSIGINRVPSKRPSEGIDGLLCPGSKLARTVADLPLQAVGRKPTQPLVSEGMVSDGMTTGCQVCDLLRSHGLPILPPLVAAFRICIDPRAVKRERLLRGGTLREGGHDEEDSASTEGFEQRSCHHIVALPSIVESKQERRLASRRLPAIRTPEIGKVFQSGNHEVVRSPVQLCTELRFQRDWGLMHCDDEAMRPVVYLLNLESQSIGAREAG